MDSLDLDVEQRARVERDARSRCRRARKGATLLARLTARSSARKSGSSSAGSSSRSRSRSRIQPSPMRRVISSASPGFACSSQRRGVTPLVTFWKRSGQSSAKSGNSRVRTSSEWSCETPFTLWLPTIARWPMRIRFGCPSSMIEVRRRRSTSPGQRRSTSGQEAEVDLLDDLEVPRNHAGEQRARPHLERLGQQRVVGVGERRARDLEGALEGHPVLVHQHAHQLGDGERRDACRSSGSRRRRAVHSRLSCASV